MVAPICLGSGRIAHQLSGRLESRVSGLGSPASGMCRARGLGHLSRHMVSGTCLGSGSALGICPATRRQQRSAVALEWHSGTAPWQPTATDVMRVGHRKVARVGTVLQPTFALPASSDTCLSTDR
jgi:hypothetical protein